MQPILGSLSKRGLTNARKVMSGGVAIVAGSMMSAAIVPATAFAQDEAEEEAIEEIVVTGSRLTVNPNLRSASPVLSVTNEEIAAIEAGREFTAPRSRTPNRGRHPCIMIQGRSTMEVLDPDLRRRMKNAKSPEEIMRLTMEASGVTPEQLDGK